VEKVPITHYCFSLLNISLETQREKKSRIDEERIVFSQKKGEKNFDKNIELIAFALLVAGFPSLSI
jgi:hypothetical protein